MSLEALLAKGADHSLGAVAVKDAKGAEVGQLTVAVTALAALREIDASLESSAVVVELAQLTLIHTMRTGGTSTVRLPVPQLNGSGGKAVKVVNLSETVLEGNLGRVACAMIGTLTAMNNTTHDGVCLR